MIFPDQTHFYFYNHFVGEERAVYFLDAEILLSLPHEAVDWSVGCDSGIS